MSNGTLKELERLMNEELKVRGLNITVEMKAIQSKPEAYEHNILYDKSPSQEEKNKINDALGTAIKKWKKE